MIWFDTLVTATHAHLAAELAPGVVGDGKVPEDMPTVSDVDAWQQAFPMHVLYQLEGETQNLADGRADGMSYVVFQVTSVGLTRSQRDRAAGDAWVAMMERQIPAAPFNGDFVRVIGVEDLNEPFDQDAEGGLLWQRAQRFRALAVLSAS